jgi:hypothetical protein
LQLRGNRKKSKNDWRFFPHPHVMSRTADYNDVREEIKFENQNAIPHCPAPSTL